jgi:hypothetical protein
VADPFAGLPDPLAAREAAKPEGDRLQQLEQAYAVQQAQKPQAPENLTAFGQAKDVAAGLGSGLGRGVVATPGLVGDIGMLTQYAPALGTYAYERGREMLDYAPQGTAKGAYEKKLEEIRKGQTEAEKTGRYSTMFGVNVPTGQYFVEKATPYVPGLTYEPQTGAGRVAGTVGEVLGSSLTTRGLGGMRGGLSGAKTAVTSAPALASDVGAGLGAGYAGEEFRGSPDAIFAQLAGGAAGALGGRGAYARLSPAAATERGERIAGDVARQNIQDVEEAKRILSQPRDLVSDVTPTTPQMLRQERGISGLEGELRPTREAGLTELARQDAERAFARAGQTAIEAAEAKAPFPSIAQAMNLPTADNPRIISSIEAQNLFRAVEEPMFQKAQSAWQNPAFASAIYDKKAVVGAINDALNSISKVERAGLPGELARSLDVLKTYKGYGIPFQEIQDVKALANKLVRDPSAKNKAAAIAVTTRLDDLLTDMKNLSAKSPAGLDAPQAFDAARTATRQYKTLIEGTAAGPLAERGARGTPSAGAYTTQPEQFLDQIFKSPQEALSKYRELQGIPGLDLSKPASDWMIAKLTDDGKKAIVTEADLNRLMRQTGYATLVDEIPGLRDRIANIVSQSRVDQVKSSLAAALDSRDVTKLNQYIERNRPLLSEVFSAPQEQQFIDALSRSSKALEGVPPGSLLDRKLYDKLMQGNLFTILHGTATGKLGEASGGAIAGKMLGLAAPFAAGLEVATAGAISSGLLPKAQSMLSRIVYGTTQEEAVSALNRAMRDPDFMKLLLEKPTIENQLHLFKILKPAVTEAAPRGALTSRDLTPEKQQETTEQAYERLVREGKINPNNVITVNPRQQRATGGRVDPQIHAQRLILAAERAKKEASGQTETLLEQPDEHIVKALDIAKRHI